MQADAVKTDGIKAQNGAKNIRTGRKGVDDERESGSGDVGRRGFFRGGISIEGTGL